MAEQFKIGEVAKLLGLTTQALRFYEQEGVVTPHKSESGTRYYTIDQVVLLLSFKKYRQADFSVQEIVAHFEEDEIASLSDRLFERSEALIDQSRRLMLRAQSLKRFGSRLSHAQRTLGQVTSCRLPSMRTLCPPLEAIHLADRDQRRSLTAFIDAMPDVHIGFRRDAAAKGAVSCFMCADEDCMRAWSLPGTHTRELPGALCARVFRRFPTQPLCDEDIRTILGEVRAAGFLPDPQGQVIALHMASETRQGSVSLYAEVFVPILS